MPAVAADIKQIVSFYRKKYNLIFARQTDRESLKLTEKLNLYGKTVMGKRAREKNMFDRKIETYTETNFKQM
jgi:hypothetical protein